MIQTTGLFPPLQTPESFVAPNLTSPCDTRCLSPIFQFEASMMKIESVDTIPKFLVCFPTLDIVVVFATNGHYSVLEEGRVFGMFAMTRIININHCQVTATEPRSRM